MSRVGKKPIPILKGVEVDVAGPERGRGADPSAEAPGSSVVTVKGPKGTLRQEIAPGIEVSVDGEAGRVVVRRLSDSRGHREKHGLYRALIAGMIEGVTKGYEKSLEIHGVGYRAAKDGEFLAVQVGYADTRKLRIPEGLEIELPDPQRIVIRGADKCLVGSFAATVRAVRPPDLYKNKGIRYAGEAVRKLAGKTFASGST